MKLSREKFLAAAMALSAVTTACSKDPKATPDGRREGADISSPTLEGVPAPSLEGVPAPTLEGAPSPVAETVPAPAQEGYPVPPVSPVIEGFTLPAVPPIPSQLPKTPLQIPTGLPKPPTG